MLRAQAIKYPLGGVMLLAMHSTIPVQFRPFDRNFRR